MSAVGGTWLFKMSETALTFTDVDKLVQHLKAQAQPAPGAAAAARPGVDRMPAQPAHPGDLPPKLAGMKSGPAGRRLQDVPQQPAAKKLCTAAGVSAQPPHCQGVAGDSMHAGVVGV